MNIAAIALDAFLMASATVLLMLLLGATSRRLLGMRMSAGRIILAGALGLGAGVGFESRFVWQVADYTPALIPVLLSIILLVAIAVLVLAELLIPQGSLPRPGQWRKLTRQAFDRNRRYAQLLRIIAKHRLFAIKLGPGRAQTSTERRTQALALKQALEEAGGAFVKLGQLLSTRPDVLPSEFFETLGTLQQHVPPASWDEIEPALEHALGGHPRDVFAEFSEMPFAAASIGQVHAAMLHSGERAAVKIRRSDIVPMIERDIDVAERLARRLARSSDWAASFGIEQLVNGLTTSLRDELDYTQEAANIAALAGSIGRIDSDTRSRLGEVLLAFSRRDAGAFTDAMLAFVDLGDVEDEAGLRRDVAAFMSRRLGPGARLDATVFSEVMSILADYGLAVPAELTVPFRTIATVEGSLQLLDPEFDFVAEAGGYAQARLREATLPTSITKAITDELLSALPIVKRLPHRIDRVTGSLADGRFGMNVRMLADSRDRSFVREIIGLAVVTFLAGVFGIMAAMLLTSATGPQLTDTLSLFQVFGYLFLVVAGVLTLPAALGHAGLTGAKADALADATRQSAGTTIMQLREQGTHSSLGDQTATAVDALTSGFADATRWALLIATVFLALGFIGALRLRRASVSTPINSSTQEETQHS